MQKLATKVWNPADHLETEADMAAYREDALEEGDPLLVGVALEDIACAESRRASERPK